MFATRRESIGEDAVTDPGAPQTMPRHPISKRYPSRNACVWLVHASAAGNVGRKIVGRNDGFAKCFDCFINSM
jgi:hypothetical protein